MDAAANIVSVTFIYLVTFLQVVCNITVCTRSVETSLGYVPTSHRCLKKEEVRNSDKATWFSIHFDLNVNQKP